MNTAQNHNSTHNHAKASRPSMQVEIWSDVMCPFCYIGKRRFEEALRHFPHAEQIAVTWKSFQLDPTIPISTSIADSTSNTAQNLGTYAEYLAHRKGMSISHVRQMFANVAAMGAEAGVTLNFDTAIIANSFPAHRLLHLAHADGRQNTLKEVLLKAHFTEGADIGNLNTLISLGESIGLNTNDIQTMFAGKDYEEDVQNDIHEAQHLGIQGVPFFVFNRRYAVSGAQSSQVFAEVLQQSFDEWSQEEAAQHLQITDGEVCTPDGICA